MQLNFRYIVSDCNTEGMCQEAVWLEQGPTKIVPDTGYQSAAHYRI